MEEHQENKWMVSARKYTLWTLGVLLLVPMLVYLLLFRANQFSLELRLTDGEQITVEAKVPYVDPGAKLYLKGTLLARAGIPVDGEIGVFHEVNVDVPGIYTVFYSGTWFSMGTIQTRTVMVQDTTPPQITLYSTPGRYTVTGGSYAEEGYSAWDNCDGDLTSSVTRLKTDEYVTYMVMDKAGNYTSISRKIYYYDAVAPTITLLGDDPLYVTAGYRYSEPGWIAQDNVDGDISDRVVVTGDVDKYLAGSYELTYSVTDLTGNQVQAVRTVVVQPKYLPKTVTPNGNVIYLTFDDGPGPYTRDLLRILEHYGAKATFFVVDSEYNDLLSEIVAGGHSIGIHSVTHNYRNIYASPQDYFKDLLTMQEIIFNQTGVKTYLMRFPGGSSNTVSNFNSGIMSYLTQAVQDNGFQYFDWHVDSNDAGGAKTAQEVFDNVTSGAANYRVCIVLQHDTKAFSIEAVEKILIWGREHGYQFLGLNMTSPTAHHNVNN